MNRTLLALSVICLVAVSVRLYPVAISGLPFSTDAWPLIRNTELLVANTPTPVNSLLFDGYNNYWPGVQFFGAMLGQVTSLPVVEALAWGVPFAAAVGIPIFFMLVKKITQNTIVAAVAALLLATAFPYALFTAGVTKETYAAPIFFTLILLFMLKPNWKTLLLFTLTSFTLVLSHHFSAFLAVVVIWGLCLALVISKKPSNTQLVAKPRIICAVTLSGLAVLYLVLFAYPAMNLTLTVSDLLSVGAYEALLVALAVYAVYSAKGHSAKKTVFLCLVGFALLGLVMLVTTRTALAPGAPTLPLYYFLYAVPFLLGVPLIIFGFRNLYQRRLSLLLPFFWIIVLSAFTCYAVFSSSADGIGLAYRSLNFILPPFVFLAAIGVSGLISGKSGINRKYSVAVASILCLIMVSVGVYSGYASVVLEEPYFGYFWRYEKQEYQAYKWVASGQDNQTVTGDFKVSYLLEGYFNRSVSVTDGLKYLEGDAAPPELLCIYRQMYRNGYVFANGAPIALPQNWTAKLSDYNAVYVNKEVSVYAKP